MRVDDRGVWDVDPQGVMGVSAGLMHRCVVVAAQRRVCERIDVVGADPEHRVGVGGLHLGVGAGCGGTGP